MKPLRILVIEDEMTIALMLEDMLADLGHGTAGMAMRLPKAMELARTAEFDLAILDVNLDGRTSYPVAEVLDARGIPFIFSTGYGAEGLEPRYRNRAILDKPFVVEALRALIARVVTEPAA